MSAISLRNFRRSYEISTRQNYTNTLRNLLIEISTVENQNTNPMMISLRPVLGVSGIN
jgi:hypothetical protein